MRSKSKLRKQISSRRTLQELRHLLASLASLNRRSENVRVEAGIIPEPQLGDIEWEVFCTDFVKRAPPSTGPARKSTAFQLTIAPIDKPPKGELWDD